LGRFHNYAMKYSQRFLKPARRGVKKHLLVVA
jgi:hypothetical protein